MRRCGERGVSRKGGARGCVRVAILRVRAVCARAARGAAWVDGRRKARNQRRGCTARIRSRPGGRAGVHAQHEIAGQPGPLWPPLSFV
eukprot:1370804-Prymnesium_polylepis.1